MNNEKKPQDYKLKYMPPKLPFKWLASTFIVPLAIIVLPDIFIDADIPMINRVVVGLILLSIMLFVFCIILTLQRYDEAYTLQVLDLRADGLSEEIKLLEEELESFKKATLKPAKQENSE